ncbi:MAG: minor capsid protein [Taibaiella sp.]|nr:minor capsid protein [Taibaiella sp.]
MAALVREDYQGCCVKPIALSDGEKELDELYAALVQKIYNGELVSGIDAPTAVDAAKGFMKGVTEGFGKGFDKIDYDTPDHEMLRHLEQNVYRFSAAKNWQMNKTLNELLRDGDKVRPYAEFKKMATQVVDEWKNVWGKTEYDLAVSSSTMAGHWVRFEANKKQMPLLRYSTVHDSRVREAHRILDGTVRPVDDSFWKEYYPPNGWNCRCTVLQLADGTETPDADLETPDIPDMFRVNLAKEKLVYPNGSSYYIGAPSKELKRFVKQHAPDRSKTED